jgi:hypothetical protein
MMSVELQSLTSAGTPVGPRGHIIRICVALAYLPDSLLSLEPHLAR